MDKRPVRYHHWFWDNGILCYLGTDEATGEKFLHPVPMNNDFAISVYNYIRGLLRRDDEIKRVTVAENLDTGAFGVSIVHGRDSYNRKLGNKIALGRLNKHGLQV